MAIFNGAICDSEASHLQPQWCPLRRVPWHQTDTPREFPREISDMGLIRNIPRHVMDVMVK